MGTLNVEKKWVFPFIIGSLIGAFLLVTSLNTGLVSSVDTINSLFAILSIIHVSTNQTNPTFVEEKVSVPPPLPAICTIPRIAYLVSGSRGDLEKLWRTLRVLYHPWNFYVVHLDLESPMQERLELAKRVENDSIYTKVGNVHIITKANMATYRGPTMVSNTLHAMAILLKKSKEWDWFINLSASDYPLVTQDDLLSSFSRLDRNLNFIDHTSRLGWKEGQRAKPLIFDPGLYKTKKADVFWAKEKRDLPTAFKLFTVHKPIQLLVALTARLDMEEWMPRLLMNSTIYVMKSRTWHKGNRIEGETNTFMDRCSRLMRKKQADEGITIDQLHKVNQKNISAWNMKRMMNIVRHGALSTLDERILELTDEEEAAKEEIKSEFEAKCGAKKIFTNVAKPGSKYIYLDNLMLFMRHDEALKTMSLFEGAAETKRVKKSSLKNWVINHDDLPWIIQVRAFRERKALALTLDDRKTAINQLHRMVNAAVVMVIFVI